MSELFRIDRAVKTYPGKREGWWGRGEPVRAVRGVSLSIAAGETVGLIGESGSGKSTLARCATGLETLTSGSMWLKGSEISVLSKAKFRAVRREIQMVFQDPTGSLNPRHCVADIVEEPLKRLTNLGREERRERVRELVREVGLGDEFLERYRRQMSGGQRQLVSIARALIVDPAFVVLDEPVSSLDASVRGRVMDLFLHVQQARSLTYLFITHDLDIARDVCDRVAIMRNGRIVEIGPTDAVFRAPRHLYTQLLLSSSLTATPAAAQTGGADRTVAMERRRNLIDAIVRHEASDADEELVDVGHGHRVLSGSA